MNETAGGRVWLVTGASSGFGLAIAEAALSAGDTVVAGVRRPAAMDYLAARYPGPVTAVELDVTDGSQVTAAVAQTLLWHGRIDVLVNNAGRGLVGAVEETSERELRDLMDVHFFGPAALIRAVLPHMRAQGSGAIVNLTSMGGRFSFAGVGAYSATKFALEGLSEALALEVAPFGIKVLIAEPGAFRTGFAGGSLQQSSALPAYAGITGAVRADLPASDGSQPGDPAKAADAILQAIDSDKTPLRLALGNDAADMIGAYLDDSRAEFSAWEHVSRGTDYDAPASSDGGSTAQ
jgi:NAD(P)-dependent dehydrogenase (short-subunit alcohol dehydrogenase family)